MAIKGIMTAQSLQNHLKSIGVTPARVECKKEKLEMFKDILADAMRVRK